MVPGSLARIGGLKLLVGRPHLLASRLLFSAKEQPVEERYADQPQKELESTNQAGKMQAEAPADGLSQETVQVLEEEKKKLNEELSVISDKYKRALAETENVRRRLQKQVDEAKLFGISNFCRDLLEVADVLQLACGSVQPETLEKEPHLKSMYDGLKMTQENLVRVFEKNGLKVINPIGELFDPKLHEANFQVEDSTKEPGTVVNVTKTGYCLHDRVLRAAIVGVVKVT